MVGTLPAVMADPRTRPSGPRLTEPLPPPLMRRPSREALLAASEPSRTFSEMRPTALSEKAQSVVAVERGAVADRVAELRRQSDSLHALVSEVDAEVASAERLLRQMDEVLGLEPQLPLDALSDELRGRRLREVAVQVLRAERAAGAVIHYTEWFDMVADAGVRVGGKNPVATFLTQIAKSDDVESVRPRSGLYRLRAV